ncbi:MAG: arsenosugar biosynthesis radical SAM (seleno)protein ArsS [Burkholderiales bacterium]
MHPTLPLLEHTTFPAIARKKLEVLQVNVGYLCNQSCLHCHVNAGPTRTEMMERETFDDVIAFLKVSRVPILDITGGAPELNPHFRDLVTAARALDIHVIDRCNLTIIEQPGYDDLPQFLASNRVEVIASLPCYLEDNVNRQRGDGVFQASVRVLRRFNEFGYAKEGSGLVLNLVYNPQGPTLPPAQEQLENEYRAHLETGYGIVFNRLFTLANMPIQRFGSTLVSKGQFGEYMALLRSAHQDANLDSVMCRTLISVDWRGFVYDCDFNQMLGLPLVLEDRRRRHLRDLMRSDLQGNPIVVKEHCYACTAGQGSSCGGALGKS